MSKRMTWEKYCEQKSQRRDIRVETVNDWFWKLLKPSRNGCLEWTKAKTPMGYGVISFNRKRSLAHRLAYELSNGAIQEGLCVLHRCDNPPCCNPEHLWLGTRTENSADAVSKGRNALNGKKGEKHYSAKLTNEQVVAIRKHYAETKQPHSSIALHYGVSKSAISHLLQGKTWGHI